MTPTVHVISDRDRSVTTVSVRAASSSCGCAAGQQRSSADCLGLLPFTTLAARVADCHTPMVQHDTTVVSRSMDGSRQVVSLLAAISILRRIALCFQFHW